MSSPHPHPSSLVCVLAPLLARRLQVLVSPQITDADALWIGQSTSLSCQDPQRTRPLASRASLETSHIRTRRLVDLGSPFPSVYVLYRSFTLPLPPSFLDFCFPLSHRTIFDTVLASSSSSCPSPGLGYNATHSFSLGHPSFIAVRVCCRRKQFFLSLPFFPLSAH